MKLAPQKPANSALGFTLLEMLVAVSLLSLISLLVFSGLKLAGLISSRIDRQSTVVADVSAVQDLLRILITQAYPAPVLQSDALASTSFQGRADMLELTAPLPHRLALGGLYRIRLAHDADRERLMLSWRLERNEPAFNVRADIREVSLLSRVQDLQISYFGQRHESSAPAWHEQWENQPALPRVVRIQLKIAGQRRSDWPALLVAPRIDVDATCVFDALTRGCRGR